MAANLEFVFSRMEVPVTNGRISGVSAVLQCRKVLLLQNNKVPLLLYLLRQPQKEAVGTCRPVHLNRLPIGGV